MSTCGIPGRPLENLVDGPSSVTESFTPGIPDVASARAPDAGENQYRINAQNPDGPLLWRKSFLLLALEPPADRIRKLLTDIEFSEEFTSKVAAEVEGVLQQIEAILDEMRLKMREQTDGERPSNAD